MPAYEEIVRVIGVFTALRETHDDHHGDGVAKLAVKLAAAYGLPAAEVELIRIGALLHDAGKLLINADLINQNRKLSRAERAELETHTTLGWTALSELDCDEAVCDIARHHQEWWNGKGYPDGLKGDEIPIGAQMVGLCDAYEALLNDRSYRKGYDPLVAKAMIQKDKNKKFNPQLVDLFFEKVQRG